MPHPKNAPSFRTGCNGVYCLLLIAYCLLFTTCSSIPQQKVGKKDIEDVYHKEVQYLKARISNDLNTMYSLQHPEYKTVISLDKFVSESGYIQLNYSAITEKNPLPQIEIPIRQFPAVAKDFRIAKCFVDKKGKYAKFHIVLIMDIYLPITKGKPIESEVKDVIYWEKVNGEWFILNKARPNPLFHISGAVTTTPINLPEEKAEYIEVDIKLLPR
ncbi:MAG: hypothetical protein HY097_01750 [Nitrospinae bacterium]|nr:hypothetical protein [Nitrospinota bacterium]